MSDSVFYLVKFHTDCEVCGKRFEGVFHRMVPKDETSPLNAALTEGMKDAAGYVDARNTRRWLNSRLQEHRWSEVSGDGAFTGVSYVIPHSHACPHCGARQSWDPMTEPTVPEKTSGRIGYMLIGAVVCGIFGMLVGLFAMAFSGATLALIICSALGVIAGAAIGYWAAGTINQEELDTYDERLAAYQRSKQAYDAFQQSLAQRTVHNEPVPDIDNGRFGDDIPAAADF